MSVPILYQGSLYKPGVTVPIPGPPAPLFSAAEIGAVNASTVAVTFDGDVTASDYATGVTIKVNGTATSITSATRQSNHAIVYYVIPVLWHGSGDTVTWEYASGSGNIISELNGVVLGDVTAQSATNNCEYAALLDLQADTLALADGDPISTWSDQSGQGHDFTGVTLSDIPVARQTDGDGYHYAQFNSLGPNYCDGGVGEWIDNLNGFTAFSVEQAMTIGDSIASKMNNTNTGAGWALFFNGRLTFIIQEAGGNNWIQKTESPTYGLVKTMCTRELISKSDMHIYRNGILDEIDVSAPPVLNYSSTDHVLLGSFGNFSGSNVHLYSILICAPAPSSTNRAALEARLAARYGITL